MPITYHKQLFVDGELKTGMYSTGPSCASVKLAKQTKLLYERQGATEPINGDNRRVAIVMLNGQDGVPIIVDIL